MKIAIGSTSPHKLAALTQAIDMLLLTHEIVAFEIPTKKWDQQPVGFDQTLRYAKDRAQLACRECPEAICIGIESGIIQAQNVTLDIAVIVALTPEPDNNFYFSTSPGLRLPPQDVKEAERRGFKTTTVGQMIAERLKGDPTDPLPAITSNALNRRYQLFVGIYMLFLQLHAFNLL